MAGLEERFPAVTKEQEEIVALSLEDLSGRLRLGQLSARTVMEAFFAKAVAVNKRTNAVTEFLLTALDEASEKDKVPLDERPPFHGVPFSVKVELNQ